MDPKTLTQTVDTSLETTLTLATSHALVMLEEAGIVGDPMEKTTLESIGWTLYKGDRIAPCPPSAPRKPPRRIAAPVKKGKAAAAPVVEEVAKPDEPPPMSPHQVSDIAIRRRFQFSSALKRMSTVSLVKQTPQDKARAFASVKGAPETLKAMFTVVPPEYESTYKYYAQKGSRVLALGYKWLDGVSPEKVRFPFPRSASSIQSSRMLCLSDRLPNSLEIKLRAASHSLASSSSTALSSQTPLRRSKR